MWLSGRHVEAKDTSQSQRKRCMPSNVESSTCSVVFPEKEFMLMSFLLEKILGDHFVCFQVLLVGIDSSVCIPRVYTPRFDTGQAFEVRHNRRCQPLEQRMKYQIWGRQAFICVAVDGQRDEQVEAVNSCHNVEGSRELTKDPNASTALRSDQSALGHLAQDMRRST